jgi:hypothetical protein
MKGKFEDAFPLLLAACEAGLCDAQQFLGLI